MAEGGEQVLFVGTHERQLDDKGRIALPATHRAHLGEQCYLVKGADKCIDVIPTDVFERVARTLMERVESGDADLNRQRAMAASANLVNIDKQGRITLDEGLRSYAELSADLPLVVAGNFDRLQVWTPDRFQRVNAEGSTALAGAGA